MDRPGSVSLRVAAFLMVLIFGRQISNALQRPASSKRIRRSQSPFLQLTIRGQGIPYVDSYEEQTTRMLWESDPFSTSKCVVARILREKRQYQRQPLLTKVNDDSVNVTISSGYEGMFHALYGMPPIQTQHARLMAHPNTTNDKRRHFLLELAYRGDDFCGWQTQPNNDVLPSVQKTLEDWLQVLEGDRVDVRVCGRTDAGVHAIGQVARYRSQNSEITVKRVQDHLEKIPLPNGSLKCLGVIPATKSFHPSFGAESRAYVYLIDADHWEILSPLDVVDVLDVLNEQLQSVQGVPLDYVAISYGRLKTQTSICTLLHAQAHLVKEFDSGKQAICIELVGDRFLRRMVRMLVENTLRVAVRRIARHDASLLEHIESRDRRRSGNAAPPDGLIFVDAAFGNPS